METIKSPGILFYVLSFYSYYLPIILYVLWTPLSIYDLGKREDLSKVNGAVWTFFIILVPWLGSLLYFLVGKSKFSTYSRVLLTIPGLVLAILFAVYSTLTST
jgi:hypothetical protein